MRTRRFLVLAVAAAAAVGATGCGSSGGSHSGGSSPTSVAGRTTTTTTGAVATSWRDDTAHWRQLAPGAFALGRAAVADELAARYRGGDTSEVGAVAVAEVNSGEPLVVVLRETGVSDTVAGRDIEITLEGGDAGWGVASARVRDACVVAVDEAHPTRCA